MDAAAAHPRRLRAGAAITASRIEPWRSPGTGDVNRALQFLAQPSLLLLLGLGGAILAYPFLEASPVGRAGLSAVNITVMILALRVIGHTPTLRRVGLLFALP